jgi:hypothetical protein
MIGRSVYATLWRLRHRGSRDLREGLQPTLAPRNRFSLNTLRALREGLQGFRARMYGVRGILNGDEALRIPIGKKPCKPSRLFVSL